MTSKWIYHINAAHILRVLASLKSHMAVWAETSDSMIGDVAYNAASACAWATARDTMNDAAHTSYYTACDDAHKLCDAVCDVIMALIAYEDSAHLLDSSTEEIRLLVALGHPYAILFLQTVIAFSNIKALTSA